MKIVTLCRVSMDGKVFRLTGLFREGEKVAFAYRIFLGRRRLEPCDYQTIDYALKVLRGVIESRVVRLLSEGVL